MFDKIWYLFKKALRQFWTSGDSDAADHPDDISSLRKANVLKLEWKAKGMIARCG